jgi:hypothetical protein
VDSDQFKLLQARAESAKQRGQARLAGTFQTEAPSQHAPQPTPNPFVNLAIKPTTDEDKLNKLERRWLAHMRALNMQEIGIQSLTLKIGDDCRYTPDFTAITDGHLVAYETKGFMRDDAQVKIKVAARKFRWIEFVLVTEANHQWIETPIKP